MNNLVEKIFEGEITKKGIEDLKEKYPEDLKVDMSDDAEFKAARKTRTEKNKLVEAINRRRIDITTELKKYSDGVIGTINNIYDVVTLPFETEDQRRKDEAKKVAEERDAKLAEERTEIRAIGNFYDAASGKPSDEISGIIESVDLIEVDHFDKELIHEAMEVKKVTLEKLDALLSDTKSREILAAEREKLAEESAAASKKAAIVERLNTLKMIPTTMFGKSSKELSEKITSIKNFSITDEEFGDMAVEGNAAAMTVIGQLEVMESQQKTVEDAAKIKEDAAIEAGRIAKESAESREQEVTDQKTNEQPEPEEMTATKLVEQNKQYMEKNFSPDQEENHPETKEDIVYQAFCNWWENEMDLCECDPDTIAERAWNAALAWTSLK